MSPSLGGGAEVENLELARRILALSGKPEALIQFVTDRPGRDRRYALECEKIRALGWRPAHTFDAALEETVRWYQEHEA
jgi:dTDP-glucose 4,6-dehydratase